MDLILENYNSHKLPSISILVTSFNHKSILQCLLPQLFAEEYPSEKYEILVVDAGSTDGSREWLSSIQKPNFRAIFQSENQGRSAARNGAIRAAHNDIIIMLDGDHTIDKGFIVWHARQHIEHECIVVGQSQFRRDWRYRALLNYLNTRGARKLPLEQQLPGRYFRSGNCSVPKTIFELVGIFDETFTTWGGEDLELGVRFQEAGLPIVYEPRARAWHHHHRPLGALLKNLESYGRESIPLLLEKHPQLYRELNLHQLEKPQIRFLMTGVIYHPVRILTNLLLPFYVPPVVFDYLHLRQYGRGFLNSRNA